MPPHLSAWRGSMSRGRVRCLSALIGTCLIILSAPTGASAQTPLAIATPARAQISGWIFISARGFDPGVVRAIYRIDGRRIWIRRRSPFGHGGWFNTRWLRAGRHVLSVQAVYRHSVRWARHRFVVARRSHARNVSVTAPPGGSAPAHAPARPSAAANAWVLMLEPWRAVGSTTFVPLSDAAAAALVVAAPETRPSNATANQYVPTSAQLQAFRSALDPWNRTPVQANPYNAYVTGDFTGTTDEIIQWAAAKWGIPVDWLRAQYMQESRWCDSQLGDLATVSPTFYNEYPPQARVPGTDEVYESMGISQIKWVPDGSVGAGTEPLRWESTAFDVDYEAATVRFYFDNPGQVRSSWRDPSYVAGQTWNSIGGWFNPYPWANASQLGYVKNVQGQLLSRSWTQPVTCS